MARGDDLEDRLIDFAVRVVKVCQGLPSSYFGNHIGHQLIRSSTAPAAIYGEARTAESQRDFVHKMKIALKELNESRIWLKIIVRSELIKESRLDAIIDECDQLCRIMAASIKTSKLKNKERNS